MDAEQYIAIDLKSFYASVECMERGLDPMTANLVVADASRTEKTICLAVSPALKAYGIPGRPRLFEVVSQVKAVNAERKRKAPLGCFTGKSIQTAELKSNPSLALDFVIAAPQMAKYMEISTRIYHVYLKYIAPEDIHVYSIDEVLIDATHYLKTYRCTARELALRMIRDVLATTGITATAGIGSNLYLCKIAMDILAKKMPADRDGVRIAELDEASYRKLLWSHKPLTSFWRVGKGYAAKLEKYGIYTMGDIARCSLENEDLLYQLFGVNAELLIDHAWGYEPCRISEIKSYRPRSNSICAGQVLTCAYTAEKARLVVHEMIDAMALDLVEKRLVTDQIVLDIGYDVENLNGSTLKCTYEGEVVTDRYGRKIPKHAHGTQNLDRKTSSSMLLTKATLELFDRVIDSRLSVRRITLTACNTVDETDARSFQAVSEQLDMFTDYGALEEKRRAEQAELQKERARQETIIRLRRQYGKNAILKGMSYEEGATAKDRNRQIGGHKA